MRQLSPKSIALCLVLLFAHVAVAAPESQQTFASPEDAAAALFTAAQNHDQHALSAIFGPDSQRLLSSGDKYADAQQASNFANAYSEKHSLNPQGQGHYVLEVGANDWPLPIPIVEDKGRWHFDTHAGDEEIIDRRIGRNELAAIRTLLAAVDAQHDFFDRMKQQTGSGYYASRFLSVPGQHDGLYWPPVSGQPDSPLEALIEAAENQGYPGELVAGKPYPYQGYYFRILRSQGPYAPGGAKSYSAEGSKDGRLTDGFAMIAWPATFAASGIMTFQVDQDGTVFQKDLGPDTAHIVTTITRFDADLSWTHVVLSDQ